MNIELKKNFELHLQSLRRPYIFAEYLDLSNNTENIWSKINYTLSNLHNESYNIYTQLCPAILLIIIWPFLPPVNLSLQLYYISIIIQLFLSSYYHIARCCFCYDKNDLEHCLHIDLFGIWLINTFSIPPSLNILFQNIICKIFYFTFFIFYSVIIYYILFVCKNYQSFEIKLIIIVNWIGCMCLATIHSIFLFDIDEFMLFSYGPLLHSTLFLCGLIFYTFHIPECFAPGLFDIYFNSHQLFHICVTFAAIHWFWYLQQVYDYKHTIS